MNHHHHHQKKPKKLATEKLHKPTMDEIAVEQRYILKKPKYKLKKDHEASLKNALT